MSLLEAYETTYGKMINIGPASRAYEVYNDTTSATNLNYEFINGREVDIKFITGFNREERELPILDHPIVVNRNRTVMVDVRSCVTGLDPQDEEQPLNLLTAANKLDDMKYLTYRACILQDFLEGKYGLYKSLSPYVAGSYATLVAHVVDSIVKLSPAERSMVEIIATNFCFRNFVPPDDLKDEAGLRLVEANTKRVKFSFGVDEKFIDNVNGLIRDVEYTGTIKNLIENFVVKAFDNGKERLLNSSVFVNICSNMWYGIGNNSALLIALENIPTWMCLVYASHMNKTYKRSRLSSILDKNNKLKLQEYCSKLDIFIKEEHII